MAKFQGIALLDGGPDLLRTRAATAGRVLYHLLKAYAVGDSYATCIGNSLGSVAMTAGDIVSAGASGAARVTTIGAKSITLSVSSGASPDLHVALLDSVSNEVLDVTNETTDQVVAAGGTFNVPARTITIQQPT